MLLYRIIAVLLIFALVQGCGFSPMYSKKGNNNLKSLNQKERESVKDSLRKVTISKLDFGRPGQILVSDLEDLLNATNSNGEKKYSLNITITKSKAALATEKNREITRYNLVVDAEYRLVDLTTGAEINHGRSRITESYDAVESDFATYAAEEDSLKRIMKEMAHDIYFKISTYFANPQLK